MPQPRVRVAQMQIMRTADVRRSLTPPGDLKADIAFQNDINALLARFDEVRVPGLPVAGTLPTLPVSVVADATPIPALKQPRLSRQAAAPRLRVVEGGAPTLDILSFVQAPPVRVSNPTTPV